MGPICMSFKSRDFEFRRLPNVLITSASVVGKNTILLVKRLVLCNETMPQFWWSAELPTDVKCVLSKSDSSAPLTWGLFKLTLEKSDWAFCRKTELMRFHSRLLLKAASPKYAAKYSPFAILSFAFSWLRYDL